MTIYDALSTVPWAELFPQPWTAIAATVSTCVGYWYGLRHPQEF